MSIEMCPYCRTDVEEGGISCEICQSRYHADCWVESGCCVMPGCAAEGVDRSSAAEPMPATCQGCGAGLLPAYNFCRSCGAPCNTTNSSQTPTVLASPRLCGRCGSPGSTAAKFCRICGAQFSSTNVAPASLNSNSTIPELNNRDTGGPSNAELISTLRELKALLDEGVIDEAEFQIAKSRLLK